MIIEQMIIEQIGVPALLEQMAEEGSELSQASLKFARKIRGENPTPKDSEQIYADLLEEMADVALCMEILFCMDSTLLNQMDKIMDEKLERWKKRLEAERI